MGCLQYARLEELDDEEVLSIPTITIPDAPWCWNTYLHVPQKYKNGPNVGTYSRHGASGILCKF